MEKLKTPEEYGYVQHGNIVLFQKGPLSQWYGGFSGQSGGFHPMLDKNRMSTDQRCNCAEQWMMLAKAAIFNDEDTFNLIRDATNPKDQKDLGRLIKNYDETLWSKHKYTVVVSGNTWKFKQNPHLKEFITQFPRNTIFAEAAPWDRVWGIGLGPEDPRALDPKQWNGENLLGKALSKVRNLL
jgi:ribA/ribD-fused uncharacterized protein